jgi:hypothetical protein
MDEVINSIALAVAAGAAAGLKDTVTKGIKDAYGALLTLIKARYKAHKDVIDSVDHLAKKPQDQGRKVGLEEELKKAGGEVDDQLLAAAKTVIEEVKNHSPETAQAIGMDIGEFKAAALHIKNLQPARHGTAFRSKKVDIAGPAIFDTIGGDTDPKT